MNRSTLLYGELLANKREDGAAVFIETDVERAKLAGTDDDVVLGRSGIDDIGSAWDGRREYGELELKVDGGGRDGCRVVGEEKGHRRGTDRIATRNPY